MSRIDDLLLELCPPRRPGQALGEIARLVRGNGMPKTDLVDEGVGAIHYGQIYTRYGAWTDSASSFRCHRQSGEARPRRPGDIIITNTSENVEDVGKAVAWLGDAWIVTGGHATVIKHDQSAKYLAYWFASEPFAKQKRRLASGTKVIDISTKQLATVMVPVPPMEVQNHIVEVLDAFTNLESDARVGARSASITIQLLRGRIALSS